MFMTLKHPKNACKYHVIKSLNNNLLNYSLYVQNSYLIPS